MTLIFSTGASFTLSGGMSRSWKQGWCYSASSGRGLVVSCTMTQDGSYSQSFGFEM